ncbi:Ger(x)C family spore germination protein [Paenibacillus harenae]|uniref:Ger(x)C family spore germination protein n=1 Tax=Paenibacillus harenae TaxID=306543 RepID=UPI0027D8B351|nr:Ger(x)C family spore germination protein [Paenibacillus harenae]
MGRYRFFIMVILCMLLSGCWNRTELNEISITSATGYDRVDGNWLMTLQVIVPSAMTVGGTGGSGGSGSAIHVFSTKEKTIQQALNKSNLENSRFLYFAHNNVLVIGREAAEEGISQIIDLYLRTAEARESVYVLLASGKASDVLKDLIPPEKLPGVALAQILNKEGSMSGFIPPIKMYELAKQISSDSKSAGVPEISEAGDGGKALESLDVFKKTSSKGKLKLSRLGVFKEDRLIGWMTWQESFGVSWMSDKIKMSSISFKCPGSESTSNFASFKIRTAKTRVTPIKEGDGYKMQLKVKVGGVLTESTCPADPADLKASGEMEKEIEKQIQNYIHLGWKAVQRMQVDLPGFAGHVHRKYPRDWNEIKETWAEKELGEIKLDVHVKATIQHPGFFSKAFVESEGKSGGKK